MHIYVCPVAIPVSAHYFLLSHCLTFFMFMEIYLEKLPLIFHSIIVVVASMKWYATKISVLCTRLVSFHSVLHINTSHLVLLRLSHIAITLCLHLTIFQQVEKREGFGVKKGECEGGESI